MSVHHEFDSDHALVGIVVPRYLFRFMRDSEYTETSIAEPYLWFSDLGSFNDPIEIANRFVVDIGFDNFRDYLTLHANDASRAIDWEDLRNAPRSGELKRVLWGEVMRALREMKLNQVSVSCCSDTLDNQLMWGHYADGHRGVCVVLDTAKVIGPRIGILEVRYVDDVVTWDHAVERLRLRGTDEFNIRFDQAVLGTKPQDWSYEREHRLIAHERGRVPIPPDALAGVVLGARMSEDRATSFTQLIRGRYRGMPIVPVIKAPLNEATGRLWPTGFVNVNVVSRARSQFLPDAEGQRHVVEYMNLSQLDDWFRK